MEPQHLIIAGKAIKEGLKLAVQEAAEWAKLANEQEQATMSLEYAMRSMGRYTPELYRDMLDLAKVMEKYTTFQDQATIAGQSFLVCYKNISDDILPEATMTMLDLAARMGVEPAQAARMLGRASMGITEDLKDFGIIIDEDVAKSGEFAAILDAVKGNLGGFSGALAGTKSGKSQRLSNTLDSIKEDFGEPTSSITDRLVWAGQIDADILKNFTEPTTGYLTELIEGKKFDSPRDQLLFDYKERKQEIGKELETLKSDLSLGPDYMEYMYGSSDEGLKHIHERAKELHAELNQIEDKIAFLAQREEQEVTESQDTLPLPPEIEPKTFKEKSVTNEMPALVESDRVTSEGLLEGQDTQQGVWGGGLGGGFSESFNTVWNDYLDAEVGALEISKENWGVYWDDQNTLTEENMTYQSELMSGMFGAMQSTLTSFFTDMFTGQLKSAEEYFKSFTQALFSMFAQMIAKMIVEALTLKIAMSFLPGLGGGGGGFLDILGGLFHTGGMGYETAPRRRVPAFAFAAAPRAHLGLGPDERPVIIKRNEGVFTDGQMKALGMMIGQGGGTSEPIHVHVMLDKREIAHAIADTAQRDRHARRHLQKGLGF